MILPTEAAVRINSILCSKATVSKGQTGIIVNMEVENLDVGSPVTTTVATLTYSFGQYETTLNSPSLPAIIPAAGKVTFKFTVSVFPIINSGVCTVNGAVETSGGNDSGADLTHKWTVQQPAEVVVASIFGPDEVTRGSSGNQAIMDIERSGEADILINSADLLPVTPSNYANWKKISPDFPQNFAKSYWWNDNWFYRRQLTITNRSPAVLPKTYEIKLTFDHQKLVSEGKSLANGDDIRVVYFNGVSFSQIDRYLDPLASGWNQTDTTIWFRLQEPISSAPGASDKYAIYYGADGVTAANPPANPANVFVFFDNFESGVNGWSQGKFPTYTGAGFTTRWQLGKDNNGDGTADNDDQGPVNARSGNNYWATDILNRYTNSGQATAEMISLRSPNINLAGKLNPTMSFWDFYDVEDGGAFDYGVLRVCEGPVVAPPAANGLQLQLLESVYLNQHGPWQKQTYSLAPSVGKTVYIEFTFGSDWAENAYGWAVDDLLIRQIASPEPDNPLMGVEEQVPLTPTIKVYFDIDVSDNAIAGNDIIDGVASGTEGNTGQTISDNHATLPLEWLIRGQNFKTYSNTFYASAKNTFNIGETIYCKGTGYTPSVPCMVKWLDPSENTVLSAKIFPDTTGNIYCSREMLGTDPSGQWRIIVTNVSEAIVLAETGFNLNSPAQLVSQIILPEKVISGQQFTIVHRVSNAGQTSAIGVNSSALAGWGSGNDTTVSGPVPTSVTVPGGGSAEFVWTAVAGSQGQLTYRGNCSGTVDGTANTVSSPAVTSNVCMILQESVSVTLVEADDTSVNIGQTGLQERITLKNAGTADLNITGIDLLYHQGATDHSDKYTSAVVQPDIPAVLHGNPFPAWWNTAYSYRQRLRITGDARNYAAGCSARIAIDTSKFIAAGQMQADADDWRVVYWNDITGTWTELNRDRIEDADVTWFKLQRDIPPFGVDEGYFIYYGNPGATNPPRDLDQVYLFFEDWETPVMPTNNYHRYNRGSNFNNEWFMDTSDGSNTDGIYIARNQLDGANPLSRGAQSICLRRLDFGGSVARTIFGEVTRSIDTQTYPAIKLSFWRYFDDCSWAAPDIDWASVMYWDGTAAHDIIYYPANGPDDQLWHYEEYDLSGFAPNAAAGIRLRANFSLGTATNNERIVFDDIRAMMAAPDCIGLGEEVIRPTELIATFTVGVLPTAPAGVYQLNASATFGSIVGTGTYVDSDATTKDSWTVSNRSIETFSDSAMTVKEENFPAGTTVYGRFSGFAPGAATVRWYDGYPTGSLIFTDNPTADAGGSFPLSRAIPAAGKNGVWAIGVVQGGIQVATGSFRVLTLPEIGSVFEITPAQTTVGVKFDARLEVKSCVSASDFNFAAVGATPPDWQANTPAKVTVVNAAAYATDPLTNYLGMVSTVNETLTASKTIRFEDCSSIRISYDYSLVWAGACSFFVEYSTNNGGSWTVLTGKTTATGAGNWVRETLEIPDSAGNAAAFCLRFRLVAPGGTNRAYVDNVFITASSPNIEKVIFQPRSWIKDPTGSGDASIAGSPLPGSQTVSAGQSAVFSAEYMPLTQTTAGSKFYLHGPGAPALLASGLSMYSSRQLNASDTKSTGIAILLEEISASPAILDMGSVEPGSQSSPKPLTVSNTGNIGLEHVAWEFYNLAFDPYFIPNSAISADPEQIGAIAQGGNTAADLRISIPAGTTAGTYKANQFVFEDNDQDGNSIGEPIGQFELQVTVPQVEKIRAAADTLFLGSFLAGERTATATVLVTNIGNVNLNIVRFVPVDLKSGANTIASKSFNLNPIARGFLVKGKSYLQSLSLTIPAGTPAGTYSGNCFFLDDKNANFAYEVGEASDAITISVEVGTNESFTLSAATVTLPDTAPGDIGVSGNITITNTGNIPLNYLRYQAVDLVKGGETIGTEYVSFSPDPISPINDPGSAVFKAYVVMPPGQKNFPGPAYSGVQRIYNDKNQNGVYDVGEANRTFALEIRPGENMGFVIPQDVGNLGAGLPLESVSGNIQVINIGNKQTTKLNWTVVTPLISGANTIPAGAVSFNPANTWNLSNDVGASEMVTISLTIPAGQAAGTYIGEWRLHSDSISNNGVWNAGEPFETFLIQVEVGAEGIDIIEPSLWLGAVKPGDSTSSSIFSVKNIGERSLTNLKYDKPDLTSGLLPPIPASRQFYSAPDPIGLIAGGVTTGPSIYLSVPNNTSPGIYTGSLMVYQDDNNNDARDGVEISDTINLGVEVVSTPVLKIEPAILDLGAANKGETVSKPFAGINVGNIDLAKIKYIIFEMVDGGNVIPVSSMSVALPETPWAIPYTGMITENGAFTVNTTFSTPTSNFTGEVLFWEDSNDDNIVGVGEAMDIIQVKLSIGKKDLAVLEDELNFGVVEKGTGSSEMKFTVRNTGTVALSNTRIKTAPLVGPGTIPTTNFVFSSSVITPPNLNPGVTREVEMHFSTDAALPSGVYSGIQTIYEDINNNSAFDPGIDPHDNVNVIVTITSGGVLSYEFVANPGALSATIARGKSKELSFKLQSLCNNIMTNIAIQEANLASDATVLSSDNFFFTPAAAIILGAFAIIDATATVNVPANLPAGHYVGYQRAIDLDHPAAFSDILLDITVPATILNLPANLDMGNLPAGATYLGQFPVQNAGLNDSDLFFTFSDFVGPLFTIPAASASVVIPSYFLAAGGSVAASVSLVIGSTVPPGTYLGTLTLTDNDFPTETVAKMNITFIVESSVSGVVDAVVQTITNAEVANSVIPSENYIFSAFVCATDTVNDIFEVQLRVREWRYDDPITPLATHTITILGSTLNQNLEKWFRVSMPFSSINSPDLGSFTFEITVKNGDSGDTALVDGCQLEKAIDDNGMTTTQPTPWTNDKNLVAPTLQRGLQSPEPYYSW